MQASVETLTADLTGALGAPGKLVGPDPGHLPRFAVFHGANSICSQKVRAVLAQLGIAYTSQQMNIFVGETYLPEYVRLRMIGCASSGLPLVAEHTGSTSATSTGCDPAVVPTLVDRETDEAIVDSKRICFYIDDTVPDDRRLRPAALRAAIDAELDVVDNLPNYQMLSGRVEGQDRRPAALHKNNGVNFSMSKVERCDAYIAEFASDAALVDGYKAKRAKELDAAERLFTPDALKQAYAKAEKACADLNARLEAGGHTWLLSDTATMADLFWGIELLRMKNLGAGHFWEGGRLPAVERYVAAAENLPSIRSSVLDWPGATF